jgi:hypothetical protein
MSAIPTVRIVRGDRSVVINADDFRAGVHTLWVESGSGIVATIPTDPPRASVVLDEPVVVKRPRGRPRKV